jgi:hypothetical protein
MLEKRQLGPKQLTTAPYWRFSYINTCLSAAPLCHRRLAAPKFDTGKEVWKQRIAGPFTASLVLVGEHLFATNESGRTFVFKASPGPFSVIAKPTRSRNAGDAGVLWQPHLCAWRGSREGSTARDAVLHRRRGLI